jgi:hypothetical protein
MGKEKDKLKKRPTQSEIKKEAEMKLEMHMYQQRENQPYVNSKKRQLTRQLAFGQVIIIIITIVLTLTPIIYIQVNSNSTFVSRVKSAIIDIRKTYLKETSIMKGSNIQSLL